MTLRSTDALYIGMMSGTSADGIDAVIVEIGQKDTIKTLHTYSQPYPQPLRKHIIDAVRQNCWHSEDPRLSKLESEITQQYVQAVNHLLLKSSIRPNDIQAIGNHGQTIQHEPNHQPAYSIQLGNGQALADAIGVTTVCDFRRKDLLLGGQGAPLMPAFHDTVFSTSKQQKRFVLNLGGIANLSVLGEEVIGFDTGPANTLMDLWIGLHQGKTYDDGGRWAASGDVIPVLLDRMLDDPYFHTPPPKSTGPDYFSLNWLHSLDLNLSSYPTADVQATLLALTVESIATSTENYASSGELIVCGGGAYNQAMMKNLAERLGKHLIVSSEKYGIAPHLIEATGFAWLAYCQINGITSNLPSVTGAREVVSLGEKYTPR